ncbi:MAG: hypothetical protein CMO61_11705 [Verrucomicrobiales bacterium]|jgi:hypothetical protein|nr:hypothetical protein [Verrucomicrobiales bacterium]|tara:strand:+ start:14745 stop:15503 length:759 start_codon:yes stop_codon:yes gene_type:complete
MNIRAYTTLLITSFFFLPALQAQLRRPGVVTIKKEDRKSSQLVKEDGVIYLEGMVVNDVVVRISIAAPAYSTLAADRWLGTLLPNQNAILLAVSEKAYRVRAKAKQGQIAGWISKGAVAGLHESFETNLHAFYDRYVGVKDLIDNHQVALGMTLSEVIASIGPPDKRSSKVTEEGRSDTLEFIAYERVPRTVVGYDSFGVPYNTTTYVEVESSRVTIELENNTVITIEDSEGVDLSRNGGTLSVVPPPVFLF